MTSPAALQRFRELFVVEGEVKKITTSKNGGTAYFDLISAEEVEAFLVEELDRREAEVRAESAKLHLELVEDGVMDERERVRGILEGMRESRFGNDTMKDERHEWADRERENVITDVLEKLKS